MKELLTVALSAFNEVLKKLPDYEQKRREKYEKLILDYKTEIESDYPDSRRVYELSNELLCCFQEFKAS